MRSDNFAVRAESAKLICTPSPLAVNDVMGMWAALLCFVAVLVVDVVYCQNNSFNLELIDIVPCQESSQLSWSVSLYESDILAVDANLTLCHGTSWSINQYNVSMEK
jgi:hypothetical protein